MVREDAAGRRERARRRVWTTTQVILLVAVTAGATTALVLAAQGHLSIQTVRGIVQGAGPWAAAVYLLLAVAGHLALVPGTLIWGLAAIAFPLNAAIPLAYTGALLGMSATWSVARLVGGRAVRRFLGDRAPRLEARLRTGGATYLLFLRLTALAPYNVVNYLAGLVPVAFIRVFLANAVGTGPLLVAVVVVVDRIGTAPTLADLAEDPVFWGGIVFILVVAGLVRLLRKRFQKAAGVPPE